MDHDGSKIASLLLVFFNHFPELFEQNMICRSISPIIVARKGNDEKKYFTLEDYKKDEAKLKGYKVIYNKGLGGLDNSLYKQMMREPIFHYFSKDDLADRMLRKWFAKGIADERKSMLKETVEA
jgi:DNA gyrase/topoisomerase IV subunit B